MKIQFASDLHLEFPENKEYLRNNPLKPEGEILILAGDIVPFRLMNEHTDFLNYISDHYGLTFWLPGNHEYYHSDINERSGSLNEKIRENVVLVNNTSFQSGSANLIFSTLWTRISSANQSEIELGYSDFHAISSSGRKLSVEQYNLLHEKCLSFLKKELEKEKSDTTIVVTHHMPTFMNYPEELREEAFNEAFGVELSDLINAAGPDYWIFGHEHSIKGGFNIGKTRMVTNHLGYVRYNEFKGFDNGKVIII
jgi:predicted phosphohydrolase